MTALIRYQCPYCTHVQRSPGLCPDCNALARDEIASIPPGIVWIIRLVWWQVEGVTEDLRHGIAGTIRNYAPAVWERRYFVGLVFAAVMSLLLAAAWASLKISQ